MKKAASQSRKVGKVKPENKKESFNLSGRRNAAVAGIMILALVLISVAYMSNNQSGNPTCKNQCGDGACDEFVCEAIGCPCAETTETCPQDCKVNNDSACGKNYTASSTAAQAQCRGSGGDLACETVCSDPGGCSAGSCQCICGGDKLSAQSNGSSDNEANPITTEEKAMTLAEDYVHNLYCFNNYNSSNLKELNFTKVSDEKQGTYKASYLFNIDTDKMVNVSAMSVDLVISNNIVTSAKVSRVMKTSDGFCGYSTNGPCSTDGDCFSAGCSGQICQSKSDESSMTTCEWKDCYSAEKYNLSCKCMSGQCIWN
jgi:eight-cysteine-cluster-containing protein